MVHVASPRVVGPDQPRFLPKSWPQSLKANPGPLPWAPGRLPAPDRGRSTAQGAERPTQLRPSSVTSVPQRSAPVHRRPLPPIHRVARIPDGRTATRARGGGLIPIRLQPSLALGRQKPAVDASSVFRDGPKETSRLHPRESGLSASPRGDPEKRTRCELRVISYGARRDTWRSKSW